MVEVAFTKTVEVAKRLVEVALVNTAVEAPVVPIEVLLIVPPSIVRPFTTIVSMIELAGNERAPDTYKFVVDALVEMLFTRTLVVAEKLVVVIETASKLAELKLVVARLVVLSVAKKPLVEVILVASKIVDVTAVPDAEVKVRGPARVPPARGK